MAYSGLSTTVTDLDMGTVQYNYYAHGKLFHQTDAKGFITTFSYDELDRIKTKIFSNGDPTVTYTYDPAITNGNGRLASVTNTRGTTTINAYDPLGRVTQLSKTIQGNATTYVTQYAYDLAGKQTRIIYPDNFYVTYNYYPGTGLLNNVVGSDGKTYGHYSLYEPTGKIGQVNLYNSTATRYTYDPATTRLFGIVTTAPGGLPANDIQNMSYTYTLAGDITQIVNNKAAVTYNYAYDLLHRLISETHNGSTTAPSAGLVYGYGTAHVHAPTTIAINGTTKNFTYDQSGNMSGGHDFADPANLGTRSITYNADDKPVQIDYTKGTTTSVYITYDGEGTRIKKTAGSSTTYYIGGHYEIKNGVATKHIMGASAVIASITGANTYYYSKDHLGSSTAMTDSSGAVVESTDYAPYGPISNHTGATVTNYKYTDQELDPETNLYNYGARYYDPAMGMFISADTIIPQPDDPQSFNRYAYALNNPMKYTDPSGHESAVNIYIMKKFKDSDLSSFMFNLSGSIFGYNTKQFAGKGDSLQLNSNQVTVSISGDLNLWNNAAEAGRATAGIIGNSFGIIGGIGLGVSTGGIAAVAGGIVVFKSAYGLSANAQNLYKAAYSMLNRNVLTGEQKISEGALLNDVANLTFPGNKNAQRLATAVDLTIDVFSLNLSSTAKVPSYAYRYENILLEGGGKRGPLFYGNADKYLEALTIFQAGDAVLKAY